MQVKVAYTELPSVFTTQNFSISVINPCLTDTLSLDETKFASPAKTYTIRDVATVFSWADTAATSDKSLTTCGPFAWQITNDDGVTAIDPTVFTLDLASKTITVFTTDSSKN